MGEAVKLTFENTLTAGLKEYFSRVGIHPDKSENADKRAKKIAALAALRWMVEGSPNEVVIPPIKDGILRGSGSAFVGSDLVGDTKGLFNPEGTPNTSYSGKVNTITIGFNTSYAKRMHETEWEPGPVSRRDPAVLPGPNKWVERHLAADGKLIMGTYARVLKQESGG